MDVDACIRFHTTRERMKAQDCWKDTGNLLEEYESFHSINSQGVFTRHFEYRLYDNIQNAAETGIKNETGMSWQVRTPSVDAFEL
jgi:hypothetical protein